RQRGAWTDTERLERIGLRLVNHAPVHPVVAEVVGEPELCTRPHRLGDLRRLDVQTLRDRSEGESAVSSAVSRSVTSRPSARVNRHRWEWSHRAKAVLIARARSMNVCEGPTAKTRPGQGHSSAPRPP